MQPAFSLLQEFQRSFLPVAENFFNEHAHKANQIGPVATEIIDKLKEFTLQGGKRIRPALLYYGYQCFSDQHLSEVLKASVACELMQSFLLIHDDLIDEAELRRGQKTLDKKFSENVKNRHYGKSMAILAGNIAGYLGLKVLANIQFEEATKYRIMDIYSQICIDEGYGEALDLSTRPYEELSEDYIYNIYKYKTSRYTTEFPLICAALLAGKEKQQIKKMEEIGSDLGIMFQIQDDILGLFGDASVIGKSTLSDLTEGKKTLLLWKAWEESNSTQKNHLQKIYGNSKATVADLLQIQEIIKTTGSLDYAKTTIKNLANQVEAKLTSLNLKPNGKNFIIKIMNYFIQRDV